MMLRCGRVSLVAGLLLALIASEGSVLGQDKPDTSAPNTSPFQSPAVNNQNPPVSSDPNAQQDDNPKRILGIIPNFETTNDTPAVQEPITGNDHDVLAFQH